MDPELVPALLDGMRRRSSWQSRTWPGSSSWSQAQYGHTRNAGASPVSASGIV